MEQTPDQAKLSRSQLMVRELLEERRELLVQLNNLAGTTPGEAKHKATPVEVQQFCQLLYFLRMVVNPVFSFSGVHVHVIKLKLR